VTFADEEYTLADVPDFTFSTRDEDYGFCVSQLVRLVADQVPQKLAKTHAGEGTYEAELYLWLYSCLIKGCSDQLNRAWYACLVCVRVCVCVCARACAYSLSNQAWDTL
jgi:hypothetical protein